MLLDDLPRCKTCGQPIETGQKWEYGKVWYPAGTPEVQKNRYHRTCVTTLAGEVAHLMAQVPENGQ